MDRYLGSYLLVNHIVYCVTLTATLHSQLNDYLVYEKNQGGWEEDETHPVEKACDRLPQLLIIIRSLCIMLSREDPDWDALSRSVTGAAESGKTFILRGSRKEKIEATFDMLVEGFNVNSKLVCAEEKRFTYEDEVPGKWSLIGLDDLCSTSVRASLEAVTARDNYKDNPIGPAEFKRDMVMHSLSGILNLL